MGDLLGIVVYAAPDGWAWPSERMTRIWPTVGQLRWDALPTVEDMQSALILAGIHPDFRVDGGMTTVEWRQRSMEE